MMRFYLITWIKDGGLCVSKIFSDPYNLISMCSGKGIDVYKIIKIEIEPEQLL